MVRALGSVLSVSLLALTLGAASAADLRAVVASGSGGPVAVTSCALQGSASADGFPRARIAIKNGGDKNVASAHLGLTYFRRDGNRRTQVGRAVVAWPSEGVDAIEPGGSATYDAPLESTVPPAANEVACSVVDAQYEDGTTWSAPAVAAAPRAQKPAPRPTSSPRPIASAQRTPAPRGDDRLWLGFGTSANPLVNGAPKYCTANQTVAAWASEPCHFARLAWAEQQAAARTRPTPQPRAVAQARPAAAAHTPAPATPRPTIEPTPAPDDAAPGEEAPPTPTAAPAALLPEPTLAPAVAPAAPAVVPTPQARATRPSYASGPSNPMWQRMSGNAPPPRAATPAPEPAETDAPVAAAPAPRAAPQGDEPPQSVARSAEREAAPIPSDVLPRRSSRGRRRRRSPRVSRARAVPSRSARSPTRSRRRTPKQRSKPRTACIPSHARATGRRRRPRSA
jgi:hypothetical protein